MKYFFVLCLLFVGCSSNEAMKWELQAHKLFVRNVENIVKIDSLEVELSKCKDIKLLRVTK